MWNLEIFTFQEEFAGSRADSHLFGIRLTCSDTFRLSFWKSSVAFRLCFQQIYIREIASKRIWTIGGKFCVYSQRSGSKYYHKTSYRRVKLLRSSLAKYNFCPTHLTSFLVFDFRTPSSWFMRLSSNIGITHLTSGTFLSLTPIFPPDIQFEGK